MKTVTKTCLLGLAALCFALRGALGATAGEFAETVALPPLDVAHLDAEWSALFDEMETVVCVAAPFTEERFFAFRKEPKVYQGFFRKSEAGSVSLAYTEPEVMALHIGEGFAYYKKGDGAVRSIPQSDDASGALAIFPALLGLDFEALSAYYDIRGECVEKRWQLVLEAKAELEGTMTYARIEVEGDGRAVQRIELLKSAKQRIVIVMGEPVYPEFYVPTIKAKYFFRPE